MRGGSHRLAQGIPCGRPARKISADEWWRPAGGGAVKLDGHSAPGRVGGKKRMLRESTAASKGERWGGDRS